MLAQGTAQCLEHEHAINNWTNHDQWNALTTDENWGAATFKNHTIGILHLIEWNKLTAFIEEESQFWFIL